MKNEKWIMVRTGSENSVLPLNTTQELIFQEISFPFHLRSALKYYPISLRPWAKKKQKNNLTASSIRNALSLLPCEADFLNICGGSPCLGKANGHWQMDWPSGAGDSPPGAGKMGEFPGGRKAEQDMNWVWPKLDKWETTKDMKNMNCLNYITFFTNAPRNPFLFGSHSYEFANDLILKQTSPPRSQALHGNEDLVFTQK